VQAPDYSDGIMIALLVPETVGERLALDGGLAADDLHITLAYLGSVPPTGDDPDRLFTMLTATRDGAAGHKPITGQYNGVARFSGTPDALVLTYDSPDIASLRADVVEALDVAGIEVSAEHGFVPHTTLAYLQRKEESPLARIDPLELRFDRLHLVYGETAIPVPLAGTDDAAKGKPVAGSLHAYPSTTSPTVNRPEGKDAAFESLHPRTGGKFTTKPKPAQAGQPDPNELPPDWLDRVLRGDPRYVQAKKGGGKGKKGGSKHKRDAAARAARRKLAQLGKDKALAEEMDRRNTFDDAIQRADQAERARHEKASQEIEAEHDPQKKAELEKAERENHARYVTARQKTVAGERARRRQWEQARRRQTIAQLAGDVASAQASASGKAS
jgi:2'-5' RNA ligase